MADIESIVWLKSDSNAYKDVCPIMYHVEQEGSRKLEKVAETMTVKKMQHAGHHHDIILAPLRYVPQRTVS